MAGVRERFFEQVGKQGHVPLLEHASGTVLVEISDGGPTEQWYVTIHRGDVSVSRKGAAPDCTIRTDGATFDAVITGKVSPMPALLRGLLEVEGRINLLVALQALFQPSAGGAKEPAAGYARRRS
jgi:putative sterol carrier protein